MKQIGPEVDYLNFSGSCREKQGEEEKIGSKKEEDEETKGREKESRKKQVINTNK